MPHRPRTRSASALIKRKPMEGILLSGLQETIHKGIILTGAWKSPRRVYRNVAGSDHQVTYFSLTLRFLQWYSSANLKALASRFASRLFGSIWCPIWLFGGTFGTSQLKIYVSGWERKGATANMASRRSVRPENSVPKNSHSIVSVVRKILKAKRSEPISSSAYWFKTRGKSLGISMQVKKIDFVRVNVIQYWNSSCRRHCRTGQPKITLSPNQLQWNFGTDFGRFFHYQHALSDRGTCPLLIWNNRSIPIISLVISLHFLRWRSYKNFLQSVWLTWSSTFSLWVSGESPGTDCSTLAFCCAIPQCSVL